MHEDWASQATDTIELGEKRYVEMSAIEQFVLTISEKGMGKRTSSYEYRITNRGGKGIVAMGILEGKKGAKTIRPKTGKLSDAQRAVHARLEEIRWPVAVVTSVQQAFDYLRECGAPWSGIPCP